MPSLLAAPNFRQPRIPPAARTIELIADGVLLVIVLVIVLGRVKLLAGSTRVATGFFSDC
jgi:hypothetical protein